MDSKQLKIETRQLPNIQHLVNNLKLPTLDLPHQHKQEIEQKFSTINKFKEELSYAQVVNEKIASLAHHLHDLQIATLTNDTKKTKHLISLFLKDPHINLKQLIFEVTYLESQLSLLQQSYSTMFDNIPLALEDTISLSSSSHNATLKKLNELSQQQKKYVQLIGQNFISFTRNLSTKGAAASTPSTRVSQSLRNDPNGEKRARPSRSARSTK